ncbi:MAG: Tc toxin subunit A, partial [Candidatus Binataceae bacterium]
MSATESMPTWSDLVGPLDTREADAGRSVTSPAAYLADLLQLLEDRFEASSFNGRRPDILEQILLNGEQSFTLVRQLDVVNRVLGDRIAAQAAKRNLVNGVAGVNGAPGAGKSADDVLAEAQHPFALPFEYQHEQIRLLLALLKTSHRELYSSFAQQVDIDVIARERLGLSPARAAIVVKDLSGDSQGLRVAYGLADVETLSSLLDLDRLARATQLDGNKLRELLFLRLSQTAIRGGGVSERDEAAGQLFINSGLDGFVTLDADERNLRWSVERRPIPPAWFDRVHRLVCLSRWTGVDLAILDLVLRQLCRNKLDENALRTLAVLVDLRERTGAAIEVLCCLFGELGGSAALGAGNDPAQPASLFDRVFNGAAAGLARRYVPSGAEYVPQAYSGWQTLAATGDLLADEGANQELRVRIQSSLGISARDLSAVVTCFRDRAAVRGRATIFSASAPVDSRVLSALYRVARLAEFAGVPPVDLLRLAGVLEEDPSVRTLNAFDIFHHEDVPQLDPFEVLETGTIEARFWLIQNLVAIGAWASSAGLAPEDLEAAAVVPTAAAQEQNSELLATAQALLEAFLPVSLKAESLESDAISPRAARVALAIVRDPARRLVAPADDRLVTLDDGQSREAAYAALGRLGVVSVEDLESLGLGEEVAPYLRSLLVRRGVLDTTGVLRDGGLPARAEALVLEPDGSARFAQIFAFLHDLYIATAEESAESAGEDGASGQQFQADSGEEDDPSQEVELQLFPSDLIKLGFEVSEADEWIERLTFLGMLDASGTVLNSSAFADPANRGDLRISVGLDTYRAEIYAWLAARCDRWLGARLTLPDGIWDGLPLSLAELEALEQNLAFNGYIDAE